MGAFLRFEGSNIDDVADEDRIPATAAISAVSLRERCETTETTVTIP
jgi:hypothetical protein